MTLFIVGFLLGAWTVGGLWLYLYLCDRIVEWEKGEIKAEEQPIFYFILQLFDKTSEGNWNMVPLLVLMGPYGWFSLFWGFVVEPLRDKFFKTVVPRERK